MAVAFVRTHTAASIKTAGTNNIGVNISTATTSGNTLVAYILFDNFTTASKPVVSSIARMAGETNSWVFLGAARSTSTSSGAFASGEMWAIKTTVAWSVASYTVTLDSSVTMKANLVQEFSGVEAVLRSTAGTAYSTTTTAASAATTGTTPVTGDLTVGFIFGSNVAAAQAGDTDTSAGSWSAVAGVGSTGSTAATNNFGVAQYKILTAATAQTLNNSAAMTAGNGAIVAILQQYVPPAITQAAYRFYADEVEFGQLSTSNQAAVTTSVPLFVSQPKVGESFSGDGKELTRASFGLKKSGAPDGIVTAELYAYAASLPTGSPLAVSTTAISSASLTTSPVVYDFDFAAIGLTNGTSYYIVLSTTNSMSITNYVGVDLTASGYSGLYATYGGGTWTGTGSNDVWFRLYTRASFAAQNAAPTIDIASGDVNLQLRTLMQSTSAVAIDSTDDFQLQWDKNASGSWTAIGASTVIAYNSPNLTDAASTGNRLTGGTGTFTPGEVSETGLVSDLGWAGNNYTELLYSLTLKAANLASGDTLRFRVLRNGATTGLTYTQTPTITITAGQALTYTATDQTGLADSATSLVSGPLISLNGTTGFKHWDGSQWVRRQVAERVGSQWMTRRLTRWSGSSWDPVWPEPLSDALVLTDTVTASVIAGFAAPTGFVSKWTSATVNTLQWTDSTSPGAVYDIYTSGVVLSDWTTGTQIGSGIAGGTQTLTHNKDASQQAAKMLYYGIIARSGGNQSPAVVRGTPRFREAADWLPSTIAPNEQAIQGLVHITSADVSKVVALTAAGAAYTVDWGDGSSVESLSDGALATHTYTYSTMSNDAAGGQRQARLTVRPQSASLTGFTLDDSSTRAPVELVLGVPSLSALTVQPTGAANQLKYVHLLGDTALPTNALFSSITSLVGVFGRLMSSTATFAQTFNLCSSLMYAPHLDLSGCSAANGLFESCTSIPHSEISLSGTSGVTAFNSMFKYCSSTAFTDPPLFDTSAGTTFGSMFEGCVKVVNIPAYNTANVTSFSSAFSGCSVLKTVAITSVEKATSLSSMFYNCGVLPTANLPAALTSGTGTSLVTSFSNMFYNCFYTGFTTPPLMDTSSGTNFSYMFYGCTRLSTIPAFNTANGTNFSYMFSGCTSASLTSVPLLDTAKGTNFTSMFAAVKLTSLPAMNCAAGTVFTNMLNPNTSNLDVNMTGARYSISISGCAASMSVANIDKFYTNLGTAAGAQTVTVTALTNQAASNKALATAKGWTVV